MNSVFKKNYFVTLKNGETFEAQSTNEIAIILGCQQLSIYLWIHNKYKRGSFLDDIIESIKFKPRKLSKSYINYLSRVNKKKEKLNETYC